MLAGWTVLMTATCYQTSTSKCSLADLHMCKKYLIHLPLKRESGCPERLILPGSKDSYLQKNPTLQYYILKSGLWITILQLIIKIKAKREMCCWDKMLTIVFLRMPTVIQLLMWPTHHDSSTCICPVYFSNSFSYSLQAKTIPNLHIWSLLNAFWDENKNMIFTLWKKFSNSNCNRNTVVCVILQVF